MGKRNNVKLSLNDADTEAFIQNWESNVFSRQDITDLEENEGIERDQLLDNLYKKFFNMQ